VYSGDDHLALPVAAVGGVGVVSVASHVAGDDIKAMLDAYFSADVDRAATIHQRLLPLIRALFAVTSPIPVKAATGRFGFSVGRCRLPLCELTPEQRASLDVAISPWLQAPASVPAR
jgi:4-hydroxy-tetrahydrodipicolinate synthase